MAQALQSWLLPAALVLVGGLGAVVLFRLLLLPLRALRRSIAHAQEPSTDARLLPPADALAISVAATALGSLTGTATAIALGGPGAVTWVVLGGLASAALRYTEAGAAWQTRALFGQGERMTASVAPVLRGLSAALGKPAAYAYLGLALLAIALPLGAGGGAELGRDLASAFGGPARFAPVVLALAALGLTWNGPALLRHLRRPLLGLLALTGLALLVAALSSATRIPGALGRMLEQAFTGGAPSAGFLGCLFMQTLRLGLTRGLLTGSALGVGAALHGGSGAASPHRAGLVASLEPLAASVLLPLLVGLAVVSTRAWNTQFEMTVPLAETHAYLREPASAAELDSDELALDGIIRVREGQSFDRFFLAVHRGLVNEPRFQLGGKPWDGAIRFADGEVTSLLEPTGRFGALDKVDLAKARRIVVTGEGPLIGAPLVGRAFAGVVPTRWGTWLAGVLLAALGLGFALALVLAADNLGGGLAGKTGALAARVGVAACIATAPLWVVGRVAELLPLVAVAAVIPYAIGVGAAMPRALRFEDDEPARASKAPRR